jgi:urea transport system substrate-binding protein
MSHRRLAAVALGVVAAGAAAYLWARGTRAAPLTIRVGVRADPQTIRVGVLHSLTGTMTASEGRVADATLMALEEVNGRGGLLGRRVQPILRDGQSDWATFAREAERLIVQDRVDVLFGCWTSACRKTVAPIVERHHRLLFYPLRHEGLEQSPYIVYTGAAPNQQIIPAVKWASDHLGRRFFMIGSDDVFPRVANAIIRDLLKMLGCQAVGEEYVLGSDDVGPAVDRLVEAHPDVVLNTINGDSNVAFFQRLREAGVTSDRIPVMSFSIAENELETMGAANLVGDYAAWNYFQTVDERENRQFIARIRQRFGADRVLSDPMEAAYVGVQLWALAVEEAGTTEVEAVRKSLGDQSVAAPEGVVYLDRETQHTWKWVRIGRIRPDGQFDIVWDSGTTVRPVPFPPFRSREEWLQLLDQLHTGWAGGWANPRGKLLANIGSR